MNYMENQSRREFIKSATVLTAAGLTTGAVSTNVFVPGSVLGSNNKIRMGFIGIGNRGSELLNIFMKQPDCEIAALCDLYEPFLQRDRSKVDPRWLKDLETRIHPMGEKFANQPKLYTDYRKLLDDKSIDAVCIATPDHWHAIQTIDAIRAGKDVYVEKPLTATIVEGRKMVEAQAASDRVVTVGLNRRGSPLYRKMVQDNILSKIGKVTVARSSRISNMYPDGIGKMKPEEAPKNFNWDMWLGPRAYRPFQYNIAPYKFRWWKDFSTQMGNWGVHYMDAIRWLMGERAPVAISATGGKYVLDHDGDIPDTMQVVFEFASGAIVVFSIYEASSGNIISNGEIELRGTKGTMFVSEKNYQIVPAKAGQFQNWKDLVAPEEVNQNDELLADGSSSGSTGSLIRNFLDCVKSRQKETYCTLEDGHRSTSFAHLANIAMEVKERLQWDADKERFTNSDKANKLLHYEYRKPWKI